ncbi:glycoside hydrolase family 5 protein [Mycena floridula]|nr:glycoside hydrolase family 5 protein [Mycena floridula]
MQKLKSTFHASKSSAAPPKMTQEQEFYRYRKQRGVNLGSWFVLERWICAAPFRSAASPAQSDLDVARGQDSKSILEQHMDSWITETDFAWIAQRGLNSVRIPIGYYHLCGLDPLLLRKTDFEPFHDVYSGAWHRIVKAIQTAHRHGLGVLLDLHAAPGKQNPDAHAGTSNSPAFFSDKHHRQHTIRVLRTLVQNLAEFPNVIGVELLNEPQPSSDDVLKTWYAEAIKEIRSIDSTLPLYLGDCWRMENYAQFIKAIGGRTLTVLDHHLYRCFTAQDTSISAMEHARMLRDDTSKTFARVSELIGGALVIGEWETGTKNKKLTIAAQLELFERHCAGWWFWTYKKQESGDKGWSLRHAIEGGVFPDWVGLKANRSPSGSRSDTRDFLKEKAQADHVKYWSQYPSGHYQHARFGEGFLQGWDDAFLFFSSNSQSSVPEIGFAGAWAIRSTDNPYWEHEHGFKQGIEAARRDFVETCC